MLIDKVQAKLLTWVSKAKETPAKGKKPARPILAGVHFTNDAAIAADGFRLFAVKEPGMSELAGKTVELTKITPTTTSVDVVAEPEGHFPDHHTVMPKKEPIATIYVNAELLKDALTSGMTKLVIYDWRQPMEVYGAIEEHPTYALVMPMYIREDQIGDDLTWRPS